MCLLVVLLIVCSLVFVACCMVIHICCSCLLFGGVVLW